MSANSLQTYLSFGGSNGSGASLSGIEIGRALNQQCILDELHKRQSQGLEVDRCVKVRFTDNPDWIDVLVEFAKTSSTGCDEQMIVTYEAKTGQVIAIARLLDRSSLPAFGDGDDLPFALAARSHTVDVVAAGTDPQFTELTKRREEYGRQLGASAVPVFAASTPYTTTPTTNSPKQTQTPFPTSGVTTPNDQDTQTDNNIDPSTDPTPDPTQDYREDP